jgi:diadenosine tetraphosphate (Ap4A) HIT family hydrolase
MNFQLDPILQRDSIFVGNLQLCQVRLINNADFPWLILVPMKNNLVEITDLTDDEYYQMNLEIRAVAKILKLETNADKLNIATIGNVVSQMHIHIIARYKNDKLFPKPVWGCESTLYSDEKRNDIIEKLKIKLHPFMASDKS